MYLKDLKKEMPFKWRVQSCNQYGAKCVAYIDARDVQDKLDEVCGQQNWSVDYEEHKGNLFCKIGIQIDGVRTYKSDCGTESNVEKQKGEASDAFKRAAVMWGIGRFLYSKKIVTIKEVAEKNGKYYPTKNGKKIWDITEYCNSIPTTAKRPEPKAELIYTLTIEDVKKWNGRIYARDMVYVDGKEKTISKDQIDKLKTDKRYIKT